ncbi:MAG: DUF4864 domain-containing protein [Stellaceae bacterium]
MRPLLLLILLVLLAAAPGAARAGDDAVSAADTAAIRGVIQRQIAAFAKDDAATAFSFASPALQRQFGSPENFMRMVETGYRAVYHPRSVEFGAARRGDGTVVQEVDVIGPDGLGVRAFYLMEQERDGSWRINGVSLAPGSEKET